LVKGKRGENVVFKNIHHQKNPPLTHKHTTSIVIYRMNLDGVPKIIVLEVNCVITDCFVARVPPPATRKAAMSMVRKAAMSMVIF